MEKSGQYLSYSIEVLEKVIKEEISRIQGTDSVLLFTLEFMRAKSFLQYAAILSQLTNHKEALEQAMKAKEALKETSILLGQFAKSKNLEGALPNWTTHLETSLDRFLHETQHKDPTKTISDGPGGIIFWKHNSGNNEKYLKQELAKRGGTIDGSKMKTSWLEEFNIGNIMHLNPLNFAELSPSNHTLEEILTEERLVELVLVYSCCLFSIATENRFICHKELDTERKATEINGPIHDIAKNYQLLQNEHFLQRWFSY